MSILGERNMHEAIEMHLQGLLEDNLPILEPAPLAECIAVYRETCCRTISKRTTAAAMAAFRDEIFPFMGMKTV